MNNINSSEQKHIISKKKILKNHKKLFKKNSLHAAEILLLKLMHHGYDDPDVKFKLAETYDKLAYLTGETDYEDKAMDLYDDLVNFSDNRKFKKKASKEMNRLARRISQLNENEVKAKEKALHYTESKPKTAKSWFILGANFSIRKDPFFVLEAYQNAVKLAPNYIAALFRAAYILHHNLRDTDKAVSYYLKLIKIDPMSDTLDSKSNNVKTIIEACSELSDIFIKKKKYSKVISTFDHTISTYKNYTDVINIELLKNILINTLEASNILKNSRSLISYFKSNHNIDIDEMKSQLRIR